MYIFSCFFPLRLSLATPDLNSVNGVIINLLYITPTRHLLYVTDTRSGVTTHKLEHLSCFFPGLLALGLFSLSTTDSPAYTSSQKQLHRWAAEGLAETCWLIYHDQESGLGPDEVQMVDYANYMKTQGSNDRNNPARGTSFGSLEREGLWVRQIANWKKDGKMSGTPPGVPMPGESFKREEDPKNRDYRVMINSYLLRPEVCFIALFFSTRRTINWCSSLQTLESFFYMWKLTGDVKWRERGWYVSPHSPLRTDSGLVPFQVYLSSD